MDLEKLFFTLLKFRSITPNDDGAFEFIKSYLNTWQSIELNIKDTKNLILYKKFGEGIHLSFAGHIDVVSSGDGWDSEPFTPTKKDGYIYARGSQDMKSGICAFLAACKEVKDFKGTLSLLITSDEEGEGTYGTIEILNYLKAHDFLPQAVIVAEPTCESVFGDSIKIGRRGSINGVIELFGHQGHAAYPEKTDNTIHKIAPHLHKLANHHFDDGDEFFAPSQLVMTDLRSGLELTNVTPGYLKLMFNVRNCPKTTQQDIKDYINLVLNGCDFKLTLTQGSYPFMTDKNSSLVKNIAKCIKKVTNIEPKYSTSGGTSDAKLMGAFGIDVVEFGTLNDTIHSPNERVKFSEVKGLKEVFTKLIQTYHDQS